MTTVLPVAYPPIDMATESPKAAETFGVPELLENILLQLGFQDLLLIQRTSKTFRNAVQGSVHLRRRLFVEAEPATAAKPRVNPYIEKFLAGTGSSLYQDPIQDGAECKAGKKSHGEIHTGRFYLHLPNFHTNDDKNGPGDRVPRTLQPGNASASWRQMYATNPPCEIHKCDEEWVVLWKCMVPHAGSSCHLGARKDQRLGTIMDWILRRPKRKRSLRNA